MNIVILKNMSIENFKGIAKAEIAFDDKNTKICGENGSGKTTIKNAFEWLLCQNVANILPTLNNKEIPNLTTTIEAVLEINGFEYKLSRISKGKYQLNKDTGTMNKVTNECTYKIDDIELKEKDYMAKLADLLGSGSFNNLQILTDKEFFNSDSVKFKWTDRRKILFEICGVKNAIQDIVNKDQYLDIKEYIVKGYATSDIKSMLAKEKKGYKDTQTKNNILIEQKTKEITDLSSIDFSDIESKLKTAKNKLNKILTSSKKENQSERINELQNELLKLNKEKSQIEMKDVNEQNALRNFMNTTYNECQNLKLQYQIENDNLSVLTNSTMYIPEIDEECPTCHRLYDEDTINKLKTKNEKILKAKKGELEDKRKIVDDIQKKYEAKKVQFEQTKQKLDDFKPNPEISELNDRILATKQALQSAKATDLNNLSSEQVKALKTQISGFERELAKATFIDNAKLDIQKWKNDNKNLADKIVNVEKKEKSLNDYVKEQTNTIVDTVNEKFGNGISWALYKEVYKNGEGGIEEDCVCMYNNTRYSSLSNGEKNIADLEVVKVLQDYYGVCLPIFSDNAESITIEHNTPSQLIELFAEKGKNIENFIKIKDIYKE